MSTQAFEPPVQTPKRRALSTNAPPKPSQSLLATQVVTRDTDTVSEPWTSDCTMRLRRHPRCSQSGNLQPLVVHISDGTMVVGRLHTCDVVLDSTSTPQMISRRHALLVAEAGVCKLVDQGALNGLLVNGSLVRGEHTLAPGDVVTFGVETEVPELDYIFEERPKSTTA